MNVIKSKLNETIVSILPITLIVIFLNFTITPMENTVLLRFIIGSILMIVGLAIFLLGIDIGITPVGSIMGTNIAKSNKIWIVVVSGFVLGFNNIHSRTRSSHTSKSNIQCYEWYYFKEYYID